ncbi:hypothetical protein HDV01_000711 [Terramyces sp. JEL0728]|nr:hypothetical protein HDV01_000711 [Terramyces sp. JEL0728]
MPVSSISTFVLIAATVAKNTRAQKRNVGLRIETDVSRIKLSFVKRDDGGSPGGNGNGSPGGNGNGSPGAQDDSQGGPPSPPGSPSQNANGNGPDGEGPPGQLKKQPPPPPPPVKAKPPPPPPKANKPPPKVNNPPPSDPIPTTTVNPLPTDAPIVNPIFGNGNVQIINTSVDNTPPVVIKNDNTDNTNTPDTQNGNGNQGSTNSQSGTPVTTANQSNNPVPNQNTVTSTPAAPGKATANANQDTASSSKANLSQPLVIVGATFGALALVVGGLYFGRRNYSAKNSIFDSNETNIEIFAKRDSFVEDVPPLEELVVEDTVSSEITAVLGNNITIPDQVCPRYGYAGSTHLSEMIDSSRGSLGTMSAVSDLPFTAYIDVNKVGQQRLSSVATSDSGASSLLPYTAYIDLEQVEQVQVPDTPSSASSKRTTKSLSAIPETIDEEI